MSLVYGDTADSLDNRRDFLAGLGIDYRGLVCARQVHGKRVECAEASDRGRGALAQEDAFGDTDALITATRGLALAVFTADCLSVFIYDPVNQAIGLVHAGWKGTREGIVGLAVSAMREKFNSKPLDLLAGLGSCIRPCCYRVGGEFRDFFPSGLVARDGGYYLDLAGINRDLLLDSGMRPENISDSGLCTYCRPAEFFSYRRQGPSCGRMMSVMMLK